MDQAITPTEIVKKKPTSFLFHPTTIILLLILDWGGFILEVPQFLSPVTLVLTFICIFVIASLLSYFLQRHFTEEDKKTSFLKALIAGIICAIPSGIMTTTIGSMILILSGFESVQKEGISGLVKMFRKD